MAQILPKPVALSGGVSVSTIGSAFEIRGNDTVLSITLDGIVSTSAGKIHVDDWITVTNVMKQLIMDMGKDENLASKYPYIRDAAHKWLVDELRK